jgi:hypothetical protein
MRLMMEQQQQRLQRTLAQGCMTRRGQLQQQRGLAGASRGSTSSRRRLMLTFNCRREGQ